MVVHVEDHSEEFQESLLSHHVQVVRMSFSSVTPNWQRKNICRDLECQLRLIHACLAAAVGLMSCRGGARLIMVRSPRTPPKSLPRSIGYPNAVGECDVYLRRQKEHNRHRHKASRTALPPQPCMYRGSRSVITCRNDILRCLLLLNIS